MLKAGPVFAKDDGRLICTLARDIRSGDAVLNVDVTLPDGTRPAVGDPVPRDVAMMFGGQLEVVQE